MEKSREKGVLDVCGRKGGRPEAGMLDLSSHPEEETEQITGEVEDVEVNVGVTK